MKKIILGVGGAFICFGAAGAHFLRLMLARFGERRSDRLMRRTPEDMERFRENTALALRLPHERLCIGSEDRLKLSALFFPGERRDYCVVCVHGYRSSGLRDHAATLYEYHRRGLSVLIPDCRAHGESEGKVIGFGWSDRLDLEKWCGVLREKLPGCRIILHGVSMGSAAVICAAADNPPGLAGVVADCPYSDAREEFRHVTRKYLHLPCFPFLDGTLLLARLVCGFRVSDCSPERAAARLRVPLLLIHGGSDSFVPTAMSRRIYEACRSPKRLLIIPGAEHGASFGVSPREYWRAVDSLLGFVGFYSQKAARSDRRS